VFLSDVHVVCSCVCVCMRACADDVCLIPNLQQQMLNPNGGSQFQQLQRALQKQQEQQQQQQRAQQVDLAPENHHANVRSPTSINEA